MNLAHKSRQHNSTAARMLPWAYTAGLTAEAAIITDCETLVAERRAAWVDELESGARGRLHLHSLPKDGPALVRQTAAPLLLRARDLADRFGVSTATILRWHRAGRLPPAYRIAGAVLRWDPGEVENWLENRREGLGSLGGRRPPFTPTEQEEDDHAS